MPTLRKRQEKSEDNQSPWFVRISNWSPPPPTHTFQLKPAAIRILRGMGLESGDSFERQQFWTLYNLDLTYTLDGKSPANPDQELAELDPENIPPKQRVDFVKEVLRDYSVSVIQSDEFYRLLLSIDRGPGNHRRDLVEFLLSNTPIHRSHVETLAADRDSMLTSPVFGALVCHEFNQFLDDVTNVGTGYCEPVAYCDEQVYLVHENIAWDLNPGLADFYLDFPDFYLNEVVSHQQPMSEITVLEEIHAAQFFADARRTSDTIGRILQNGFTDIESIVIVPIQSLSNQEIRHAFAFEE